MKQIRFDSNISAQEAVENGRTFGALVIHKDFSRNICFKILKNRYSNATMGSIKFFGDFSGLYFIEFYDNYTKNHCLSHQTTDYTISNTILGELWKAHDLFIPKAFDKFKAIIEEIRNQSISADALKLLVEIVDPPIYGRKNITFRAFMTPGMVIAVVFIIAVGLTALSFVAEKTEGVMERAILAGVKIYEILIAQIFVQIFALFVQIGLLLVILFLFFEIESKGSIFYVIFLILMQGVLGMTYGMSSKTLFIAHSLVCKGLFISVVAPDGHSALMLAFGSFFPFLMLSGVFWTNFGMKTWLKSLSYYLPQTTAVMALRNIMLKGWGIDRMWVWLGFASTGAWTLFFVILSILVSSII